MIGSGPDPVARVGSPADPEVATRHRVVIVGGGFGGLYAAKGLGGDARVQVTLVDRRNFHLFQPLLYQVATGALSPGEIAQPLRSILRRRRNTTVLLGEALAIDPGGARSSSRTAGRSPTTPSSSPPAPATRTSATTTGRRSRRASSPSRTRSRSAAASSSPSRPRSARPTRCAAGVDDLRRRRWRADRRRARRRHRRDRQRHPRRDFRAIRPPDRSSSWSRPWIGSCRPTRRRLGLARRQLEALGSVSGPDQGRRRWRASRDARLIAPPAEGQPVRSPARGDDPFFLCR